MPAAQLSLRFDVPLNGGIHFMGWIPGTQAEALSVPLSDALQALVWVPPRGRFIWGAASDLTANTATPCVKLRVQIGATSLSSELRSAFEAYDPSRPPEGPLGEFLRTVYVDLIDLINRICLFVRDELGLWGVDLLRPRGAESLFTEANAVWSWDAQRWQHLRGPTDDGVSLIIWGPEYCIDRAVWERMQAFVRAGRETEMTRHLASSARQKAHARDYRSAVLETAICLERECRLLVQRYLQERGLPTTRVTGRDASTNVLLSVWLPLIRPDTDSEQLEAAKKVVGLRNQILHSAQRHVGEHQGEAVWKAVQLARELCNERLVGEPTADP